MSTVDSRWSCVVLLAALIVHFISHGFIYSFGIYFIAIEDTYRGSKAQIAWIPSIVTGCLHLIGPFASVLVNKLGCQIVGSLGGGLAFIGLFTSLFAPNIYVLYITMGIFTGFGIGLVFLPTVLSVTIYFKKYRGIACGLALSGCGIGNFVISPLSEYMLKEYGLKGTLLILSGLLLNCIPCCMMFRPLKEKEESKFSNKQQNEKDHTSLVHQSSQLGYACNKEEHFEALLHNNACEHEKGRSDGQEEMHELIQLKQNEDEKFELNEQQDSKNIVIEIKASGESTCNIKFSPTDSAMTRYLILIKTKTTMLFFASQFFFIAGVYVPFIFVPDKAKHHGIREEDSAWIVSTMGISSMVGRIILGYFADKKFIDKKILFKIVLISSGLSTAICSWLNVFWVLVVYAVIYGIMFGTAVSLTSVVLLDIVGSSCITDAIGLNYMLSGIGGLIGPPIAGLIFDITNTYTVTFMFAGGSMLVSGLLIICS